MSVAAELTGVHPQTLRGYEAKGLVEPHRTDGGTRRYSHQDLARIEHITVLLAAGLNLLGVQRVLELEARTQELRAEIDRLRDES
ncbi:MAG: MerR family transcriptional regulator [Nocardioidaceae bacterium]